ncbi:uncharacterized protein LOC141525730 [Cotesia typhae]|uniref:uncharacterized protein LOC141525730 n=1 Tax=Cotesia typhae TaxID=2053667 RepID=UPI003D68FDBD
MRGFSYTRKRPVSASDNSSAPDSKRFKPAVSVKCHFCGEIGHKKFECPKLKKKHVEQSSNYRGSQGSPSSSRPVTCFKCGAAGHIAPNCTASGSGRRSGPGNNKDNGGVERRVNLCTVAAPTGILNHLDTPEGV